MNLPFGSGEVFFYDNFEINPQTMNLVDIGRNGTNHVNVTSCSLLVKEVAVTWAVRRKDCPNVRFRAMLHYVSAPFGCLFCSQVCKQLYRHEN